MKRQKINKNSAEDDLFKETHINYYWLLKTSFRLSANHRAHWAVSQSERSQTSDVLFPFLLIHSFPFLSQLLPYFPHLEVKIRIHVISALISWTATGHSVTAACVCAGSEARFTTETESLHVSRLCKPSLAVISHSSSDGPSSINSRFK